VTLKVNERVTLLKQEEKKAMGDKKFRANSSALHRIFNTTAHVKFSTATINLILFTARIERRATKLAN